MNARIRIGSTLLALSLIVGFVNAGPAAVAAEKPATLTGTVTSTSGRPLAGMRVSAGAVDWQATRTDKNGRYTLTVIPGRNADIYFGDPTATYMSSLKQGFILRPGRTYRVNRALPKPAFITGTITDERGKPLKRANASLWDVTTGQRADSRSYKAGFSDEDGRYRIRLHPGSYVLRFEYQPSDEGGRWYGGKSQRTATVITVSEDQKVRGVDIRVPRR